MTTKIVIAGAPHSGKSVFIEGLSESLGNQVAFVFRACPDGEGHWTYKGTDSNGVESSSLRRKGQFTNEVVDWYAQSLKEMNLSPIVLVDIGGRTSLENRKVIVDGEISHYILLYSKEEQKEEWELWLDSLKLKKVASIKSDYNAPEDIVSEDGRYSIHHLERGEQGISDRPVIKKITEIILTLIMDQGKGGNMNSQKITLAEIAKEIGKEEEEKTLPNGKVVKTINWKGEDLVAIARLFHNKSSELPEGVDFDGPGPA